MKILLLSNKVPFPPTDGSSIAMASMAKALQQAGARVHMLSLNTHKHHKTPSEIEASIPEGLHFDHVTANTNITPKNTFSNLFSKEAFHVSRFYQNTFAKRLRKELEEHAFDWIQIDGLPMAVYLPLLRETEAKISLRAHNVEHRIWEQQLKKEKNPLKKKYLQLQVKRLKTFELYVLKKIDALVPITNKDLTHFRHLGFSGPALHIPCGIEAKDYPQNSTTSPAYDVAYLASMDWLPNLSGLEWFIEEVWPLIAEKQPDMKIHLAGYGMPKRLRERSTAQLKIEGAVKDKAHFLADARLCMVPLLAGSGMRIKVLEYMVMGKCIISTSIGAEGIPVTHGENILLADDPQAFAEQIDWALTNPEKRNEIARAARYFAHEQFDNQTLGKRLLAFYKSA